MTTSSSGNASGAYTVVTVADGGMTINLEFVTADRPTPSFEADIEKAAGILSTEIRNHITVNLSIGYGEVEGQRLSDGEAAAGPDGGALDGYSTVRTDLIDAGALGASTLPTGSSIDGESGVVVWSAQEKLFGQLPPTASGIDGSAGFAKDVQTITGTDVLVGVALHELTHALGRIPYGPEPDIFDFYRFTGPGARLFSDAQPAPRAYFSIDGGVEAIARYGVYSDPSDFRNPYDTPPSKLTPEDPFDEYYDANTLQTLTSVDIDQLGVLGFNVSKPAPSGSAALAETGGGSPADFLEQYGSAAYAPAPSTPANAGLSFDAWNALGSSGEADPGGFGFHHGNDGNIGGARDAWGVSVAWSGPVGHGPGPGT